MSMQSHCDMSGRDSPPHLNWVDSAQHLYEAVDAFIIVLAELAATEGDARDIRQVEVILDIPRTEGGFIDHSKIDIEMSDVRALSMGNAQNTSDRVEKVIPSRERLDTNSVWRVGHRSVVVVDID